MITFKFISEDGPKVFIPGASTPVVALDGGSTGERAGALELLAAAAWIAGAENIEDIPNERLALELRVSAKELSRRKHALRNLLDELPAVCPDADRTWSEFVGLTRHDRKMAVRFSSEEVRIDLNAIAKMVEESPGQVSALIQNRALQPQNFFVMARGPRKGSWRSERKADLIELAHEPPAHEPIETWVTKSDDELITPRTEPKLAPNESLGLKDRPFLGRESELKELREWLVDDYAGPVIITGPSNIGKSLLAYEFVAANGHNFQEVYWLLRANSKADITQEISALTGVNLAVPHSEKMAFLSQHTREALAGMLKDGRPALFVVDGTRVNEVESIFRSYATSDAVGTELNARLLVTSTHTRWEEFAGRMVPLKNDEDFVELLIAELQESEPELHAALRNRYAVGDVGASDETGLIRQWVEVPTRSFPSPGHKRKVIKKYVDAFNDPGYGSGKSPQGERARDQAMHDLELVSEFGGDGARPLLEVLVFFGDQTVPTDQLHRSVLALNPGLKGLETEDDVDNALRALRDLSLIDVRGDDVGLDRAFDQLRIRNDFNCEAVLRSAMKEGCWADRAVQAVSILNRWMPRDCRTQEDTASASSVSPLASRTLREIDERGKRDFATLFNADEMREFARLQSRLGTYWHAVGVFDDAAEAHSRALRWDERARDLGGDPVDATQLADLQVRKVRRAQALRRLSEHLDEAFALADSASRTLESLERPPAREALFDRMHALDNVALIGVARGHVERERAREAIVQILEAAQAGDFVGLLGPQDAARTLEPVISVARLMIDNGNGAKELALNIADTALGLLGLTEIDEPLTSATINAREMGQIEAMTLRAYGVLLRETGFVERALAAHERSLEICEHATNAVSPDQAMKNHDSLARAHLLRSDMTRAFQHIKAGGYVGGRPAGLNSVMGSNFLALAGAVELHRGKAVIAGRQLNRANDAYLRAVGLENQILEGNRLKPTSFDQTFYLLNLLRADVDTDAVKAKSSLALIDEVRSFRVKWAGGSETHPRVADCDHAKAVLYSNVGNASKAFELHELALKNRRAAYGDLQHQVADNLEALAHLAPRLENGDMDLARSRIQEAFEIRQVVLGADAPRTIETGDDLAMM